MKALHAARLPARLAYLALLLLATLWPFDLDLSPGRIAARLARVFDPRMSPRDLVDGLRNILLFAGWGVVWSITAPPGRAWAALRGATLTGAAVSLAVETLQLLSSNRVASVLDLLTNGGGALLGALVVGATVAAATERRGGRSIVAVPPGLFAGSYAAAAVIEAVAPLLRRELLPGAWGGPVARLRVSVAAIDPATFWDPAILGFALWVPAGVLAVLALADHGVALRRAWLLTALTGALLAVGAELARGMLGQPMEGGAAVSHIAGATLGAALAAAFLPRLSAGLDPRRRALGLATAYALVLLAWSWRPFIPELDPAAMAARLADGWWIPLGMLARAGDVFSAADVAEGFLLYLPAGALLACWPLRRRGLLSSVWPGIWLALFTEAGQFAVRGRWIDVTDVLVAAAGVLVGWSLLRRAGYAEQGELLDATHEAG
jgi:glycopeptide antibiotics resistance protein